MHTLAGLVMITNALMALLIVGAIRGDKEVIIDRIRTVLSLKGSSLPYSAEYEMALPPQPRIAGTTEKRRFFAEKQDQLYSEQTTESQRLNVLVQGRKLVFAYFDDLRGGVFFEGPVDLAGNAPEQWLRDHVFLFNSYVDYDTDLVAVIGGFLSGIQVTKHDRSDELDTYSLSGSRLGDLVIVLGPRTFKKEMFSIARKPIACSGTSISPVAQLVNGNRPARRPNARFLASKSVKRIRIMNWV